MVGWGITERTGLGGELAGDNGETTADWSEGGLEDGFIGREEETVGCSTSNVGERHRHVV
jgi:hypothetical protein